MSQDRIITHGNNSSEFRSHRPPCPLHAHRRHRQQLANAETTAFKRSRMNFEDLMYVTLKRTGSNNNANEPPGRHIVGLGLKSATRNWIWSKARWKTPIAPSTSPSRAADSSA